MFDSATKRNSIIRYVIFASGIFLNFAGYRVLHSLQSSINIEDGVGADSLTATYATSAIFGVLVTPILLRKLGPKICILLCEFTYLTYIAVNAYPVFYTLIPAGVLTGMGEATMWPVMSLFVVHYARCYARHGTESTESYIKQFFGIFYAVFHTSAVFGNLLGYAILYGGGAIDECDPHNNESTVATPTDRDLSICGINDCQDPNVTEATGDRYEPVSQTLLYILVGVTGGMVLCAMLVHGFLTQPIYPALEVEDDIQEEGKQNVKDESIFKFIFSTVKATLLHMLNPQQILLMPFALYCGLLVSFGLNEITRAFGSCMYGVEQVGLFSALFGAADAATSYSSSKIASWIGRDIPLFVGYLINVGTYTICLFWIPTESSLWVVYIIFILVGVADGIFQPLVNELHAAYFPENQDIALIVWNLYTMVGMAWQNAWSTSVCVYLKIYIQLGFLTFAFICYGILKKIYGKTNEEKSNGISLEVKSKL